MTSCGYKVEKEEKINQNTGFQLQEVQADCQGSGMFSKLCLHTLASLFSQFLHYFAVFILLEIQWKLCESLVYIFVPKLGQLHIYVFQMGNCNVNECDRLKQNVQIVATAVYTETTFNNVAFLWWGLFFPCFVKYIIRVRPGFAKF